MKKIQMLYLSLIFSTSLVIVSSGQASASVYQEQIQESSQSTSFSSSCNGSSCSSSKVTFKSKSKIEQSQSQSFGQVYNNWNRSRTTRLSNRYHRPTTGAATLGWDHRDGTCHIRYSESNVSNYKYSTSVACDQGEARIGGLSRGSTYRFQVKQDDGEWSSPAWLRAY